MKLPELVDWARQKREGVPDGNIADRDVLLDVLRMLLEGHLARTEPQRPPDRMIEQPGGYVTIRGAVPPARTPASCDQTSRELATLIGYLEDAR